LVRSADGKTSNEVKRHDQFSPPTLQAESCFPRMFQIEEIYASHRLQSPRSSRF
jgi:hypothetical protein